jgi:hypothetical protein
VPATATSVLEIVTTTPVVVTNNVVIVAAPTEVPTSVPTEEVVSGTQGGSNPVPTTAAPQTQAVAPQAVTSLPSTGAGDSSGSNGMLYFGIGLILLGSVLGAGKLFLARR